MIAITLNAKTFIAMTLNAKKFIPGDRKDVLRRMIALVPKSIAFIAALVLSLVAGPQIVSAQMIEIATPFNTLTESNFERNGIDFGFQLQGGQGPGSRTVGLLPGGVIAPNLAFNQNGAGSAIPQFGGYDPNAQATFGFNNISGGNSFGLGFSLGKGSSRTHTSTTPSVVMQNGTSGSIFNQQFSPFVTGFIPVVGDIDPSIHNMYEQRPNYLHDLLSRAPLNSNGYSDLELNGPVESIEVGPSLRAESTAATGVRSVAAIKAERAYKLAVEAAELDAKIHDSIAKAEQAVKDDKTKLALAYYRSAIKKMSGIEGYAELLRDVGQRYEKLLPEKQQ